MPGTVCQTLVVAAWLVALMPALATAELRYTTTYRSHAVSGTTPPAVWRYMNAHPIIDPDDGPAYANLTHDHRLTVRTEATGGACRVTDVDFRWSFVLTVPRASDYGAMSVATRGLWDGFVASLKRHEEGHRTIFVGCGRAFTAAAMKMAGSGCAALERQVRAFIDRRYAACMAAQREYENRDRPRVMGAPFLRAAIGR